MLRKGQTVTTLTAKIGAPTRMGRIVDVHDEFVDVEWEDGHVSTLTRESVVPVHHQREPVSH
jgi:preprotein translocase subunit YajC